MIKITLEVTPEQLTKLAAVLTEAPTTNSNHPASIPAPMSAAPALVIPAAPTAAPAVQQMFAAPVSQQTAPIPAQPTIPAQTAPQTYTVQELGLAARPLVEMGRQQDMMNLLAEFGAPSVAELPENQRAAFAAKLRAMGGQI